MASDDETPARAKARVLVVDDAPEFVQLVSQILRQVGFEVIEATDGRSALAIARRDRPDLVVLDLTLPDLDGMEVCRQLRGFSEAYVLMLTARDDELDRVMGLRTGADDYVTKPFSPRELAARVEALLRRPRSTGDVAEAADDVRRFGPLTVDRLAHDVTVDGEAVSLTRIEFALLDALTSRPRMVHSRAVLREQVWGEDWFGDDHVVDVHIANLRKKIDRHDGPSHIRTVRGVGYRMQG